METTPKEAPWKNILSIVLFSVFVIALIVLLSREMNVLQSFILRSGWIGLLVSLGLYGLLGLSPIPSEPLTVLLSTVYGPLGAAFVAGTGNLMAAVIEYAIGSRI